MKSAYIKDEILQHCFAALMPQNQLICELCLKTGLRIGDVLSLRTDECQQKMSVREHKTGKMKRITVPVALYRAMMAQAGKVYVFEHRTDPERHKTRQAVYMDLKRAAKAFRIKLNLSPHTLRKVYAVNLMHKYGDLAKVCKALNHDNEVVTIIYALADELQERQARAKKNRHS